MQIHIEATRGTYRVKDGKRTGLCYAADYGEILGTKGADGKPIDVYQGLMPNTNQVFIVNQYKDNGKFDEHKVMIDFYDIKQAKEAYRISTGVDPLAFAVPNKTHIIHCTRAQLDWWLEFGNHKKPVTNLSFPHDTENFTMDDIQENNTVVWSDDVNKTAASLIYDWRKLDAGEELLESATMDDIMLSAIDEGAEVEEDQAVMDALVIQNKKLERSATLIGQALNRASSNIKVAEDGVQISKPMKQNGTTNIVVIYELTDGQTVSIFLHNPDTTPQRIAPDDVLISWKWLLNRKDITIVVAKENGKDLPIQLVSRRVMALVEKNSSRFAKANEKKAERIANIQRMEQEISAKETELESLLQQIKEREKNKGGEPEAEQPAMPEMVLPENPSNDELYQAAQSYLRDNLQGKVITTVDNKKVHFNRNQSVDHFSHDARKGLLEAKAVTKIAEVFSSGEFIERQSLTKHRQDDFIAFHVYRKRVAIDNLNVLMQVKAGERENGELEVTGKLIGYTHKVFDSISMNSGASPVLTSPDGKRPSGDYATTHADNGTAIFDDAQEGNDYLIEILEITDLEGNPVSLDEEPSLAPNDSNPAMPEEIINEQGANEVTENSESSFGKFTVNETRTNNGDVVFEKTLSDADVQKVSELLSEHEVTVIMSSNNRKFMVSKTDDGRTLEQAVNQALLREKQVEQGEPSSSDEILPENDEETKYLPKIDALWGAFQNAINTSSGLKTILQIKREDSTAGDQSSFIINFNDDLLEQLSESDASIPSLTVSIDVSIDGYGVVNSVSSGSAEFDDEISTITGELKWDMSGEYAASALLNAYFNVALKDLREQGFDELAEDLREESIADSDSTPEQEQIVVNGNEFGEFDTSTEEGRKALREAAFDYLKGLADNEEKVYCAALRADVGFTKSGAKKYKSLSANPVKSKLAYKIKEIIKKGVKFKDSEESYDAKERKEGISYHYLKTDVNVEGEPYSVKTVIQEDGNGKFHYDLQLKDGLRATMDSTNENSVEPVATNKAAVSQRYEKAETQPHEDNASMGNEESQATFDESDSGRYVLNLFLYDKNGNEIKDDEDVILPAEETIQEVPQEVKDESDGNTVEESLADNELENIQADFGVTKVQAGKILKHLNDDKKLFSFEKNDGKKVILNRKELVETAIGEGYRPKLSYYRADKKSGGIAKASGYDRPYLISEELYNKYQQELDELEKKSSIFGATKYVPPFILSTSHVLSNDMLTIDISKTMYDYAQIIMSKRTDTATVDNEEDKDKSYLLDVIAGKIDMMAEGFDEQLMAIAEKYDGKGGEMESLSMQAVDAYTAKLDQLSA